MSADFTPTVAALGLETLLKRVGDLTDELMIHTNRCDLTLNKLPEEQRAAVRASSDRAKRLIKAWHGGKETA